MLRVVVALFALAACSAPPTVLPDAAEVLPSAMPDHLSATGLYTDISAKKVSPRLAEFAPNNVLNHGFTERVVAGDPDASAIFHRMSQRAINVQMPPLGTEKADDAGVALVKGWIESL